MKVCIYTRVLRLHPRPDGWAAIWMTEDGTAGEAHFFKRVMYGVSTEKRTAFSIADFVSYEDTYRLLLDSCLLYVRTQAMSADIFITSRSLSAALTGQESMFGDATPLLLRSLRNGLVSCGSHVVLSPVRDLPACLTVELARYVTDPRLLRAEMSRRALGDVALIEAK